MLKSAFVAIPNPEADVRGIDALANADTGRLVTRVPLHTLPAPATLKRAGDVLHFEWSFDRRKAPTDLLERFVSLQTDDAIIAFARKFGPLGLFDSPDGFRPDPSRLTLKPHRERLAGWRRFRWQFNGLLILAAFIHDKADLDEATLARLAEEGIDVPRRTLGELTGLTKPPQERWVQLTKAEQKEHVANMLVGRVGRLIEWCGLRPTLSIETSSSRKVNPYEPLSAPLHSTSSVKASTKASQINLLFGDSSGYGPLSLFGALTLQLMSAATGTGFTACSACGAVFVPRRRQPAFGRRRYCRACGRKRAVRDATAEWRAREREKKAKRARRRT